ncbi:MAG: hypothetical protein H7841_05145 [Magnetospirillum sp. WYHS-4]
MATEINGVPPVGSERLIVQPALAFSREATQSQREYAEQARQEALEAQKEERAKAAAAAEQADKSAQHDAPEQQPGSGGGEKEAGQGDDKSPAPQTKAHVSIVA